MADQELTWPRLLARGDRRLFDAVARRHWPGADRVLPRLGRAANHGVLWGGAAAAIAAFGSAGARKAAVRGVASLALASATINTVGKWSVHAAEAAAGRRAAGAAAGHPAADHLLPVRALRVGLRLRRRGGPGVPGLGGRRRSRRRVRGVLPRLHRRALPLRRARGRGTGGGRGLRRTPPRAGRAGGPGRAGRRAEGHRRPRPARRGRAHGRGQQRVGDGRDRGARHTARAAPQGRGDRLRGLGAGRRTGVGGRAGHRPRRLRRRRHRQRGRHRGTAGRGAAGRVPRRHPQPLRAGPRPRRLPRTPAWPWSGARPSASAWAASPRGPGESTATS